MRVLLVDLDARRQQNLQKDLLQALRNPDVACTSIREDTTQTVRGFAPHVVLLADSETLDVLREIRQISDVPVLVLADTNLEATHIQALRLGADDYIVRPVSAALLAARIEAVLRRGQVHARASTPPDLQLGNLAIWFQQQQAKFGDAPLRLTPIEFRLVCQLAQRAGEVVPSDVLLDQVWGGSHAATTRYLKVFVNRLRSKLNAGGHGVSIETRRGVGYCLTIEPR